MSILQNGELLIIPKGNLTESLQAVEALHYRLGEFHASVRVNSFKPHQPKFLADRFGGFTVLYNPVLTDQTMLVSVIEQSGFQVKPETPRPQKSVPVAVAA